MPGSIATPPWMGCFSIAWYTPGVCHRYPFIHPGEERQSVVKFPCLSEQCDRQGLNPRPPDPEYKVLTAPPHISTSWNIGNSYTIFKKPKVSLMSRNACNGENDENPEMHTMANLTKI